MEFLDLNTVLVSYALCNLVCTIILIVLWVQNRKRFAGLDYYAASFVVNFIGIIFLGLRDILPDFVSLFLGNILLLDAILFLYIGISRFLGIKIKQTYNIILLAVYSCLQLYFIYINPSLNYRIILFSAVETLLCMQITWMLF